MKRTDGRREFRKVLAVIFLAIFSGQSPAFAGEKSNAPASALRKELEASYQELRGAIRSGSYEKFLDWIEPARPIDRLPGKADWPQAVGFMDRAYPELSEFKFIRADKRGDWAAYYVQSELDDSQYITVSMFRFHIVEKRWKISGKAFSYSFLRNPQRSDEDQIAKELKTNKDFKFP